MIGIIGFGRFGKLMAGYIAKDFKVYVYNRSDKADQITAVGAVPADLKRAAGQRVVILSVPISRMQDFLKEIAPLLAPDAIVVDVCSGQGLSGPMDDIAAPRIRFHPGDPSHVRA